MKFAYHLAVIVAIALSAAAIASAPAGQVPVRQPQTSTEQAPPSDQKVCRSQRELGSRIAKRICRTKDDWIATDRSDRENAQRSMATRERASGDRQ